MDGDFQMNGSDFHLTLRRSLRRLRLTHGYSQETLGKILGCVRSSYAYYETGKIVPSIDVLMTLARLYRVDVSLFWDESFANGDALERKRPPKLLPAEPERTSHLTAKEKSLVALLRARDDGGLLLESFLNTLREG